MASGDDPPTKAELDFIDLVRNPYRRGEFRRWSAGCLERWRAAHPALPKPERTKRPAKRAAPAKYTAKWSAIEDEGTEKKGSE